MSKQIICIYPYDLTTNFLEPIYNILKTQSNFIDYRIDTTEGPEVNQMKEKILKLNPENCILFFLGHGCSNCLYGSPKNGEFIPLLTLQDLSLFCNYSGFILACRSNEFLNNHICSYIAFGNMPTETSEIIAERDFDLNYCKGIDDISIEIYKTSIVDIISQTIRDCGAESLKNIYRIMILFTNKRITEILINKGHNYRRIADLLCEWKKDIEYHDSKQ